MELLILYTYFSCQNPLMKDEEIILRVDPEISVEMLDEDYLNWLYPEYQTISDLGDYQFRIGPRLYEFDSEDQSLNTSLKIGKFRTTCSEISEYDLPN